jgi:large subunit ribosomal protein L29
MKASELREQDLSLEDLSAKVSELRKELFGARVRHATGQLDSTAKLGSLRREIARVETLRREKATKR